MSFEYRFEPPTVTELEEMSNSECWLDEYCNGEFDCEDCKFKKE